MDSFSIHSYELFRKFFSIYGIVCLPSGILWRREQLHAVRSRIFSNRKRNDKPTKLFIMRGGQVPDGNGNGVGGQLHVVWTRTVWNGFWSRNRILQSLRSRDVPDRAGDAERSELQCLWGGQVPDRDWYGGAGQLQPVRGGDVRDGDQHGELVQLLAVRCWQVPDGVWPGGRQQLQPVRAGHVPDGDGDGCGGQLLAVRGGAVPDGVGADEPDGVRGVPGGQVPDGVGAAGGEQLLAVFAWNVRHRNRFY